MPFSGEPAVPSSGGGWGAGKGGVGARRPRTRGGSVERSDLEEQVARRHACSDPIFVKKKVCVLIRKQSQRATRKILTLVISEDQDFCLLPHIGIFYAAPVQPEPWPCPRSIGAGGSHCPPEKWEKRGAPGQLKESDS